MVHELHVLIRRFGENQFIHASHGSTKAPQGKKSDGYVYYSTTVTQQTL